MKKLIILLVLFVASQIVFPQSFVYALEATTAEAKLELSAEKAEYPRCEPVRIHLKITYLGVVDSGQADGRLERRLTLFTDLHVRGPVPCPRMLGDNGTIGLGQGQMPEGMPLRGRAVLPGDSLEADFYVFPVCLLSAPGEYEIWIEGKECCWKGRLYESNHLRITVVEPQGKEKEALDFARDPKVLLTLCGGPNPGLGPQGERELFGKLVLTDRNLRLPFLQEFVRKAEGSVYHPFALFSLSRNYLYGAAETRLRGKRYNAEYSWEPDYELLLQSADEFLKLYPDHPLANEEHFFRLVALYGLGKKDEAAKEYDLIHERLAPLEKMLAGEAAQYQDERSLRYWMEKSPLYVWAAAMKARDLYEKDLLFGQKRKDPANRHLPVQTEEVRDIFQSRWAPW
jgi:hypothetical protein